MLHTVKTFAVEAGDRRMPTTTELATKRATDDARQTTGIYFSPARIKSSEAVEVATNVAGQVRELPGLRLEGLASLR